LCMEGAEGEGDCEEEEGGLMGVSLSKRHGDGGAAFCRPMLGWETRGRMPPVHCYVAFKATLQSTA